jgi:hypothetical protein
VRRTKAETTNKPPALYAFYRSLHQRGVTTEALAAQLHVSGAVVRKLIGMLRQRKGRAWDSLQALLTPDERQLLAQAQATAAWSAVQAVKRPVWRGIETLDASASSTISP